jgi:glyceraldehyde 3-phosphate dehydrogenase
MKKLDKVNGDYQTQLNDWIDHEKAALDLINVVGKLWFEKSIELILFRNQLVDRSASEIMSLHLYAKNIVKKPITVYETVALATEILNSKVGAARIDIGKLAYEWHQEGDKFKTKLDFINSKLKDLIGNSHPITPKDVILYGFGRIGRLAARELINLAGKGEQLRLRAIVTRGNTDEQIVKRDRYLLNQILH